MRIRPAACDEFAMPAQQVAGVTNNDLLQVCRGSTRQNAASNALSLCLGCGRATCRSSSRS
jgi:hypothetical protein